MIRFVRFIYFIKQFNETDKWKCICVYKQTHHTVKHIMYAPWTVRTFTTFIYTFYYYQSRRWYICVCDSRFVFFCHSFPFDLFQKKLYKHSTTTFAESYIYVLLYVFFIPFFPSIKFLLAAISSNTLISHVHIDSNTIDFIIIVKWTWGEPTSYRSTAK